MAFYHTDAGLDAQGAYHPSLYDQTGVLRVESLVGPAPDPRALQAAVREYLDSLVRSCPESIDRFFSLPMTNSLLLSKVLRYENMRLNLQEMSHLLAYLGEACTSSTCDVMLATSEWKFLCTVHSADPQDCCAMSYSSHLLDSGEPSFAKACSAEFLSTPVTKQASQEAAKVYSYLERRSYRILAHAYFHHRELFAGFEKSRYLYRRFLKYLSVWAPKQPALLTPLIPVEDFGN